LAPSLSAPANEQPVLTCLVFHGASLAPGVQKHYWARGVVNTDNPCSNKSMNYGFVKTFKKFPVKMNFIGRILL